MNIFDINEGFYSASICAEVNSVESKFQLHSKMNKQRITVVFLSDLSEIFIRFGGGSGGIGGENVQADMSERRRSVRGLCSHDLCMVGHGLVRQPLTGRASLMGIQTFLTLSTPHSSLFHSALLSRPSLS